MGLDFIREKTARYIQKRDSSRAMIDVCDLLDRIHPDRVRELFGVQLRDPSIELETGLRIAVRFDSETEASVIQNGMIIGDLDKADAEKIAKRLKANGKTSGMLDVLIYEAQDISGNFKVTAAEPKVIRKDDSDSEM